MNQSENRPEDATTHTAEQKTEHTERDAQGRFTAGNAGGPGNPFARRVAELRKVMMECVTDAEMRIIVGQLMVKAKFGDLAAIKLLFQYIFGKPAATVDPDALDVEEVELFRRAPRMEDLGEIVSQRMHAGTAAEMLSAAVPVIGETQLKTMRGALLDPAAFHKECDRINGLDDEDDFDEEDADEERELVAAGARQEAPSTNGEKQGNGRPQMTRPSPNGQAPNATPQAKHPEPGDNQRRSSDAGRPESRPPRGA